MKNLDKIESFLKKELASSPVEEDVDFAWDKISDELDEIDAKKRPKGLLFFFLLLGVGLAVGALYTYQFNNSTLADKTEVKEELSVTVGSDEVLQESTNSVSASTETGNTVLVQTESNFTSISKDAGLDKELKTTLVGSNNKKDDTIFDFSAKDFSAKNTQSISTNGQTERMNDIEGATTSVFVPLKNTEEPYNTSKKQSLDLAINALLAKSLEALPVAAIQSEPDLKINAAMPDLKDPKNDEGDKKWALSAEYGAHYHTWNVQTSDAAADQMANLKNGTEESLLGLQGGIRVNRNTKKGWTFGTGVFLKRYWNQANKSVVTTDSVTKENVLIKYIVEPGTNNVVSEIFGDARVERTTTQNKVYHSQFDQIQIPLSVGFISEETNRKLYYGAEVGFLLNFWLERKGLVFDDNYAGLAIDDAANDIINDSKVALGTHVSPLLGLRISDNMSIYLRPEVQFSFSNWLSTSSDLTARPIDLGLGLGLKYKL